MLFKLILFFTFVPIVELYLLIEIGSVIGTLNTVVIILVTAIAGAQLAHSQGIEALRKIQQELAEGHLPADELFNGILVLIGGVLLLTPGFFTDFAGLSCLIPFTRDLWKKLIKNHIKKKLDSGTIDVYGDWR